MEPYYYQKMNKPQQAAYHAMQQGVLALADEIQLPRIPAEELYDVFFRLRLDHPEIFWVVSYRYRYYQDSPNIIFVPEYLFEKNKIREHQKAMQSRVEKLARPAAKFTEWEKEKYIHDFICENITYDKLKKPYSHEIIGPLGQGVGVCEGIAKSVKVLCDALGVWCVIAICGNNPEKGIKYRHTWNIVRIGGQYYHLDATFDNTLGKHQGNAEAPGEIRYDYFNLGDKAVFRDHPRHSGRCVLRCAVVLCLHGGTGGGAGLWGLLCLAAYPEGHCGRHRLHCRFRQYRVVFVRLSGTAAHPYRAASSGVYAVPVLAAGRSAYGGQRHLYRCLCGHDDRI